MVTFKKTKKGEWVACGPESEVRVGPVSITKRDGAVKHENVVSLGKPFSVEGKTMVYGYLAPSSSSSSSSSNGNGRSSNDKCRECGGPLVSAPHHRAMGGLCGSCAFDEYDC
jgi:hypothetical protein